MLTKRVLEKCFQPTLQGYMIIVVHGHIITGSEVPLTLTIIF